MPPPAETRETDPLKIRGSFPGSWLSDGDKRLVAWASAAPSSSRSGLARS